MQARNALGEAFGTKKAKAAIKAAERNRVDVGAMKDVQDFVVDSVRGGTSALPTKGKVPPRRPLQLWYNYSFL
jgi:DNA-directed RNA polymerase I subunit RPA49